MRKLSILALVVILAGALSVVGYGGNISDNSNSVTVEANINNTISLEIVGGGQSVDFGNNLDPMSEHFAMSATTLEVKSTKDNWELSHTISGGPTNVLSIGYGSVNGTQNFGGLTQTVTGDQGTRDVNVNYKLDDLETLGQNNVVLTVEFTVSA